MSFPLPWTNEIHRVVNVRHRRDRVGIIINGNYDRTAGRWNGSGKLDEMEVTRICMCVRWEVMSWATVYRERFVIQFGYVFLLV
jgi:hypothetical protein